MIVKIIGIWLAISLIGCATPTVRQWQHQLWQTSNEDANEMQEFGTLADNGLIFRFVCAELRQVDSPHNRMFRIVISCRNETDDTFMLESNPIQIIDARRSIVQSLPLDHVVYNLYGGNLREAAQISQLNEPFADYGDSLAENILEAIVNTYRAAKHGAIITELHVKEALPYELYYDSFNPTSLPAGVSTHWIEYFPASTESIMVMLQGERVEDAVAFESPPPAPMPPTAVVKNDLKAEGVVGIVLIIMALLYYDSEVGF